MDLGNRIFPVSGGVPLGQRPPQRKAYRLVELERFCEAMVAIRAEALRGDAGEVGIGSTMGDGKIEHPDKTRGSASPMAMNGNARRPWRRRGASGVRAGRQRGGRGRRGIRPWR